MTNTEELKWKHNTTPEAKAIAGTIARYNYENYVDEHNKAIDKAVELTKKEVWQDELQFLATYYNRIKTNKSKLIEDRLEELKKKLMEKSNEN
jgi:hypothetical protein